MAPVFSISSSYVRKGHGLRHQQIRTFTLSIFKRQIADLRLIFKLFVSPKGPGINYPSIFQMVIHDLKRCNDHSSPFPELSNHIYTLKDLILLIA
jgi:hypothetical protein